MKSCGPEVYKKWKEVENKGQIERGEGEEREREKERGRERLRQNEREFVYLLEGEETDTNQTKYLWET